MASSSFVTFGPFLLQKLTCRSRIFDQWRGEIRGESAFMPCLVRRLLPPYNAAAEYVRTFQLRCRDLRGFKHPAALLPLEEGLEQDIPYIVSELVRGWSLQALLDALEAHGRALPVEAVIKLIFPLVHALTSAHRRPSIPLVHGAVRPRSIWVAVDGTTRLGDFEIGGLAEIELSGGETGDASWRYQAPEREASWQKPSPAVDVFSISSILLEMLVVGRLSPVQMRLEPADRLAVLYAGGLPVPLLKLIAAGQNEAPESRPEMGAMLQELKQIAASMPPPAPLESWLPHVAPPLDELAQLARGADEVRRFLQQAPRTSEAGALDATIIAEREATGISRREGPPGSARSIPSAAVIAVVLVVALLGAGAWWAPRLGIGRSEGMGDGGGAGTLEDGQVAGVAPSQASVAPVPAGQVAPVARKPRSRRAEGEERPAGEPAWLVVSSNPTAPLFVDGQPRGETGPEKKLRLGAGRHTVRLQDPLGGPSASFEVQLEPGKTQALEYDWRRDRWTSRLMAEEAPAEPIPALAGP